MTKRRDKDVTGTLQDDIVLYHLHSLRRCIRELNLKYDGEDLNLVYKLLGEATVTFVGAMTEEGLPEEVNGILREKGFGDLADG